MVKSISETKTNEYIILSNERLILKCFDTCKKNLNINYHFQNNTLKKVFSDYKMGEKIVQKQFYTIKSLNNDIVVAYENDKRQLFSDNDLPPSIIDIEFGLGDFHNGKSTALVKLSEGDKIIYKPNNGKISVSVNFLLDWINRFYPLGSYKYSILNKENYHWLEFIDYKNCRSKDELIQYYKISGFLLCLT